MSYIARVPVGNYVYLYECESYREDGKVKGRRKIIGKIDAETGAEVYKKEYGKRNKDDVVSTTSDDEKLFSVNDIKNSTVSEFGLTDLLGRLAESTGLMDALRSSNPRHCTEIYALASHLVANGEPFMHVQDWIENVAIAGNVGNLSSQRISEILKDITPGEREKFFQEWAHKRMETEYLALDITSVSTYSELIEDVEWGYNRDGEDLPQVNLCVLMGETSHLPVYQTAYSGSLSDVTTLGTTLAKFDKITDGKPVLAVFDNGFYSKKNVDLLLSGGKRFVTAMPSSSAFAKKQVTDCADDIDSFDHLIVAGGETLRAMTRKRKWGDYSVYAHVYHNPKKSVADREKLYARVTEMRTRAESDPEKYAGDKTYTKFLEFSETNGSYRISVKQNALKIAVRYSGWFVLISNHIADATEALRIYRAKDVVEKGFLKLKNSLDLGRLRVHGDIAMQSKLFIGFVALVLMSQIHTVMTDKNLYKVFTMRQLMRVLSKRRVQKIGGDKIVFPPTREQREIFFAFGFREL
jgi:transposase